MRIATYMPQERERESVCTDLCSVTIVSILRLQSLITFAATSNVTWQFFDVSIWSTVEICVGIICASLPAVRLVLVKIFPVLGGSSARSNAYYQKNGYGYGGGRSVNSRSVTASRGGGGAGHTTHVSVSADRHAADDADSTGSNSGIRFHKTYDVQVTDEVGLVDMRSYPDDGHPHDGRRPGTAM